MSGSDSNLKKLGAVLSIFVFLLFVYSCKAVLLQDSTDYDSLTGDVNTQTTEGEKSVNVWNAVGLIADFIGFFFGLMFFQVGAMAWYFQIFLVPLYAILLFGFWGIIISYILDIADIVIPF